VSPGRRQIYDQSLTPLRERVAANLSVPSTCYRDRHLVPVEPFFIHWRDQGAQIVSLESPYDACAVGDAPVALAMEAVLTRKEARAGLTLAIEVPLESVCWDCHSEGSVGMLRCATCGGEGFVVRLVRRELVVPAGVKSGSVFSISLADIGLLRTFVSVHLVVK
jgi:hypothetical protein